jgi:hypothetical protein
MKNSHILSASILAGLVLLSGTACSANSAPEKPTTTASAQVSDSADEATATTDILATVNGYYSFIANPENYDKVKTAGADLTGVEASDEQLQTFASDFSEGFQYFDTSDSQSIKNAYKAMMLGTGSLRMGSPVEMTVPADAVTMDGDKATVNTTWVQVTEDGKELPTKPESNPDPSDVINLVKKEDGSWVIVAKDSSMKLTSP